MAKKLLEILLEENLIDRMQQQTILYRQRLYGGKVGSHILALGYLDEKQLSHALSTHYGVPEIDPHVLDTIDRKLILDFPINLAKKYKALPLMKIKKSLSIVIADPSDKAALRKIQSETGMEVKPYVAPEHVIKKYLIKYYNLPPSFMLTSDIVGKNTEEELQSKSNNINDGCKMESFVPANETVVDLQDSKSLVSNTLKTIKSDPQVFDLIAAKNFNEYADKVSSMLFLGLNKIIFFEIDPSEIRPLAAKGWRAMQNVAMKPVFKIKSNDINYYILLQENFYYGSITDIVDKDLAMFLIEKPVSNLEQYFSMFLTLSNLDKIYFLIYGDFNGDRIPEQYRRTWKDMLPKLLDTVNYLLHSE
jgi:hypothetical protein